MLRNAPIRTKLIVSLLGPLLVLAVLALVGIRQNQAESDRAARSTAFARLAAGLAPLIHQLQAERSVSISYIGSDRRNWGPELREQRRVVDREAAAYRASAQRLGAGDELLAEKIAYGLSELGRLGEQRAAIDRAKINPSELEVEPRIELHEEEGEEELEEATEEGHGPLDTPGKALEQYTDTVSDLLDINGEIAPRSNNERLLKGVAASVAISRAKDFADAQRSLLQNVYAAGRFEGNEQTRLAALAAAEVIYTAQFDTNATEAQHEFREETVAGRAVDQVDELVDDALQRASATATKLDGDPQSWFGAMSVKLDRMRTVEQRLSADVIATSSAVKQAADRRAWLYSLLLAAALVLAVVLTLITARSLIRPMRRLEAAAEETATQRLPNVVQRLQEGEQVDLDAESAPPIEVRSKDEIGHLAEAFNSVHRVAVRVAGREAALRRSVGDMFLNLARRSQSLIDRQLEMMDDLERNETDPETLERLFRLDHLATRMRRNAEDLIVLSGADPGRHWVQPMTVVDVVRAAAAEVEEYQRVEFLPLADLEVAGHAAVDIIHLLAELIENATAFSPPNTKVQIAGQAVPHGYVIEIEDRGLGMSDEELIQANERLANPPEIDFALSRVLGLYVVGRLGLRHGIKVQLRHSWYGGVTALTLLPHPLLVWPNAPQAVPEPATAAVLPSRAELPSPERAAEPAQAPSGDRLPIFEAARSDWFVAEPAEPAPLPHRQRQHQSPRATDGGAPAGPSAPPDGEPQPPFRAAPTPPPVEEPAPYRPAPAREADREAPLYRAERLRAQEEPLRYQPPPAPVADTPAPAPAAAPPAGGQGAPLTQAGLPRRVPKANLAPGMVATQPAAGQAAPTPDPAPASGRSPDEVRSMLSSYRTGLERGRNVAGGPETDERPPDAP